MLRGCEAAILRQAWFAICITGAEGVDLLAAGSETEVVGLSTYLPQYSRFAHCLDRIAIISHSSALPQ